VTDAVLESPPSQHLQQAQIAIDITQFKSALVPMHCAELVPSLNYFVNTLGFRIDAIFPADAPATAIVSGYGVSLYLSVHVTQGVQTLHLLCTDPDLAAGGQRELVAPNGVKIRLAHVDPPMKSPATRQALVLSSMDGDAEWSVGRAGLRYRDLLPERHGGAFIASHIAILEGGPVPDYVHFHKVRFQMIFCRKGWVRVVYEGQGEPFLLNAGDCVLQPPTIRHRVLESSAGAEVVEIGSPAEHITMADHDLPLPSAPLPPEHLFGGQRFTRHIKAESAWTAWRLKGFEAQNTGIEAATDGLAAVRLVRVSGATPEVVQSHDTEFCFYFVLSGSLTVTQGQTRYTLLRDDSITIPGLLPYALAASPDLEMLEVMLPGSPELLLQDVA
jgi:mannose-6-phosphate isomerase-like protein (cupin superfamily)